MHEKGLNLYITSLTHPKERIIIIMLIIIIIVFFVML